jgi:tetratricopeptide (TPR) repeat protein
MFRTLYKPIFTLLIFMAGVAVLYGQVPEHELSAAKERAISNFEDGAYAAAEPDFMILLRQFSGDPLYRYYAGICKVELNRDLEEAAELLFFASTRGVSPDVYYYLGEAYRKLYDFERAKRYYIEFDKLAPRRMARERNSKLLIRSVTTATQITTTYNPFDVKNVTFINFNDSEQYGQIRMKGGTLSVKPDEFFATGEERSGLTSLMFMPEKPVRGQTIYFTGKERSGKNGFQVMQARKNSAGRWTDIQAVDALNTEYDELLPYFDPVGRDIYFASNGREGIGGFDLYRSHFDEERNEWSEPVNLGFPVNSVFDDYLLLPGTDLGKVIFFSARQSSDTAIAAYSVHLSEPKQPLANRTPEEIRRIANLGNVAVDARKDYEAYQALLAGNGGSQEQPEEVVVMTGEDGQQQEVTVLQDSEETTDADRVYQGLIAGALRHQAVSDSLVELALAARLKVRNSEDPNDRWMYQKQIMVWEKRAAEEKAAADAYFARVEGYEPAAGVASVKEAVPSAIEKDTVINEMTVYRFAEKERVDEKAKEVFGQAVTEPAGEKEQQVEKVQEESVAIPRGSVYRIQLGVFSKRVEEAVFGGLEPIMEEPLPDRNLFKYYYGDFSRYDAARDALPGARSAGFADAFIVAWYNGNIMSVEKARKLERPAP